MTIFFIADIHLQETDPEITAQFLSFLENQAAHARALYVLGDLFEAWIGDDDLTPFNQTIIDGFKRLTSNKIPVYVMPGNRDFLLNQRFSQATGCTLLPDPFLTSINGIPVLLSHGDKLCTQNNLQKWFRWFSGNPFVQKLFVSGIPIAIRRFMAKQIRSISKKYNKKEIPERMNVTENCVKKWMEDLEVFYLIHGHTHKPGIHSVSLLEGVGTRIVLGSWQEQGEILACPATSSSSLTFNLTSTKGLI